ncbi:D-alanine--D-alanine ligase A, partial [Microbacteriaceae bacterium]|nr:D-alanine--D-alanine ligase A [Candidatus Saccharibacteria bacterium]
MTRQTVLLVFGGESSEHDVSIMSARNVYAACDNEKNAMKLCYIDRHGKWWLLDAWTDTLDEHGGLELVAIPGSSSFMTLPDNSIIHVDVLFPVLHGKNGED